MPSSSLALPLGGAFAVAVIAITAAWANGPDFVDRLAAESSRRLAAAGAGEVTARFTTRRGWLTRHPTLIGGTGLDPQVRARAALAVGSIPGVGGVRWRDPLPAPAKGAGEMPADSGAPVRPTPVDMPGAG